MNEKISLKQHQEFGQSMSTIKAVLYENMKKHKVRSDEYKRIKKTLSNIQRVQNNMDAILLKYPDFNDDSVNKNSEKEDKVDLTKIYPDFVFQGCVKLEK